MSIAVRGAVVLALVIAGCGPGARHQVGDDAPECDGGMRCTTHTLQDCVDGHWTDAETCPALCDTTLGCVECNPNLQTTCVGDDVHTCNSDGTIGPSIMACGDHSCQDGSCVTECDVAAANRSYIGCEYWPVDLDNAVDILGAPNPTPTTCTGFSATAALIHIKTCDDGVSPFYLSTCDWNDSCPTGLTCVAHDVCAYDGQASPFAIVVSNPDPTRMTTVTLANAAGFSADVMVAPQSVATIVPKDLGFPDQSLDYSGIETKSYHLTSDLPIIAYQFNPLNNVGVYTNDGSLLIPASAYDMDYYAITTPSLSRRPLRQDWNGYITIVADDGAPTTVSITPTADTREGTGVPAMTAGQTMSFTLAPFQTVTLEADALGDLTGSKIHCTPACGVFAGHEATNLGTNPGSNVCCADHLEDQLFPASTWGKHYIVVHSADRITHVPDLIRIVAQHDGTTVTVTPPQNTTCTGPLAAGGFCQFFTDQDVEITSNEPILIGHVLLSNGGLDADSGDPGLSFAIPVEQYRDDYILLVPAQYDENFFMLSAPANGTVMLDGIDVTPQLQSAGTGMYRTGRVAVTAGQHHLVCPQTCGVEAEGLSEAVSYLYAGGLNLDQIVIE